MAASGRSSSEEDMTTDEEDLVDGFDARLGYAKVIEELKDFRNEEFLKGGLKVSSLFWAISGERN